MGSLFSKRGAGVEPSDENIAFVFIKPQALTPQVKELVEKRLNSDGMVVVQSGSLDASVIDEKKLIDQHYYAIASKATLLKPSELNVPAEKFKDKFGVEWEEVLARSEAYNASDACTKLGCGPEELGDHWQKAQDSGNLVKLGGGFYCGKLEVGSETLYVFNAFFMRMRNKFTAAGASIHYFVVRWETSKLPWADFRGKVLGPTDPVQAPADSLRGTIYARWEELGLKSQPNTSDNCVHASASPFEGLAERMNWLGTEVEQDTYGMYLLKAGLTKETIAKWSVDPTVEWAGNKSSLFDALEDMDAVAMKDKALDIARG